MSRVTLIECQPRRPDGATVTVRLVDRSPRAGAYLGAQWLPHVVELPGFEMAIGFDGQRFAAAPSPQIGALAFALAPELRATAGWVWRDAPVTIRQAGWPPGGGNPADASFSTVWLGNAAGIAVADGIARVELIDRGQLLRAAAAPLRFGTSGLALLDSAAAARDRAAGQVVPMAWGRCLTVPGLLVDRLNNIWCFAARPATAIEAFYDGGAPFTLGVARASLAALQSNAPAPLRVDWCADAAGLFLARPADRPVYPFTADASFGASGLGDVMQAIVGGRLPIMPGVVAALNGLGLGACGVYIDDEATVSETLDRLLAGVGVAWKVRSTGSIDTMRLSPPAPIASFASHQRHAPARQRIILPTARRSLGFARNNRIHSEGEFARILLATDLAYADGTPIEALKPAEAGADITGQNTAADTASVAGVPAAAIISGINAAQAAAADARAVADGKVDTFLQPTMPNGTVGDLWVNTAENNRLYRHNGTTFVLADDQRIGAALVAAAGAQATADGKVRTFYGAASPSDPTLGDLWSVPNEQRLRRWNGAGWEVVIEFIANARTSFAVSMPTGGTFAILGTATLGIGPGGTARVSAQIDYQPAPGGGAAAGAVELEVWWRPVPGTGGWTPIGSGQIGSLASREPDIGPGEPGPVTPGSVVIFRERPGPTSPANQEFAVAGRLTGDPLVARAPASAVLSWVP